MAAESVSDVHYSNLKCEIVEIIKTPDDEIKKIIIQDINRKLITFVPENDDKLTRKGKLWTLKEEERMLEALYSGKQIKEISISHERTTGAIRSRIHKINKEICESLPPIIHDGQNFIIKCDKNGPHFVFNDKVYYIPIHYNLKAININHIHEIIRSNL